MYLTYIEYSVMGGTLAEAVFNDYEFGAESVINNATFNRIPTWYPTTKPDAIKRLTKRLVDIAQQKAQSLSAGIVADATGVNVGRIVEQTNDGVSTKYSTNTSADVYALCDKDIDRAVQVYLSTLTDSLGRKLLYRGLYPGE